MADLIKIPYGFVISCSNEEWDIIVASLKTSIEFFSRGALPEDIDMLSRIEKLATDLLTPRDSYGSGAKH